MNKNREDLEEWISDLRNSGKLIIVEGPNDKAALEYFRIKNVVVIMNGKVLDETVEKLSEHYKEVVILTDLDKEGRKHYKRLKTLFSERGFRVDNYFREFLFNTQLTQI